MTIGGIIVLSILCRKRRRRTVTTRTVTVWNVKPADPAKLQREKQKADRLNMIRSQSAADLVHLQQRRRDLLKAYNMIPAADTEKNIKKRIQYDNAIRNTDKQIAAARYNMNRTI